MSLAEFVALTARHILVNFCAVSRFLAHFQDAQTLAHPARAWVAGL